MPVHDGRIETDLQIIFAASLNEFLHDISVAAVIDTVVRIDLGIPEREAFMMSGRQNHVLHAGLLRQLCPFLTAAFLRQKLISQFLVVFLVDAFHRHDPLMSAQDRIEAEVHKHAKACLAPPVHAGISGRSDPRFIVFSLHVFHFLLLSHSDMHVFIFFQDPAFIVGNRDPDIQIFSLIGLIKEKEVVELVDRRTDR